MAIKKSTPTPPPRPPRTSGSGSVPSRTPSKTPTGRRPTKPVVKVQPKGAITKPAVKNPSAPKPVGSGAKGSVKVMTKSEVMMKKGAGKGTNTNADKNKPPAGRNRNLLSEEKYKRRSTTDKMIDKMQSMRGRSGMRGGGNIGSAGGGLRTYNK